MRVRAGPQLEVALEADGRAVLRGEALLQRVLVAHYFGVDLGGEGRQGRVVLDGEDQHVAGDEGALLGAGLGKV